VGDAEYSLSFEQGTAYAWDVAIYGEIDMFYTRSVVVLLSLWFAAFVVGAQPAHRVPDADKTPGHATYHSAAKVCGTKSTKDERNVPDSEKKAVYASYGIARCTDYCSGQEGCEIDHLISLELGGANTTDNLWPQPYQGEWNAHDKDRLENKLHHMVCTEKTISLKDAQKEIATDWIAAYTKYVGARKPFKAQKHCP
jgi:hypothetical protein